MQSAVLKLLARPRSIFKFQVNLFSLEMSKADSVEVSWKKSIDEKGAFKRKDSVFRDWVKGKCVLNWR